MIVGIVSCLISISISCRSGDISTKIFRLLLSTSLISIVFYNQPWISVVAGIGGSEFFVALLTDDSLLLLQSLLIESLIEVVSQLKKLIDRHLV